MASGADSAASQAVLVELPEGASTQAAKARQKIAAIKVISLEQGAHNTSGDLVCGHLEDPAALDCKMAGGFSPSLSRSFKHPSFSMLPPTMSLPSDLHTTARQAEDPVNAHFKAVRVGSMEQSRFCGELLDTGSDDGDAIISAANTSTAGDRAAGAGPAEDCQLAMCPSALRRADTEPPPRPQLSATMPAARVASSPLHQQLSCTAPASPHSRRRSEDQACDELRETLVARLQRANSAMAKIYAQQRAKQKAPCVAQAVRERPLDALRRHRSLKAESAPASPSKVLRHTQSAKLDSSTPCEATASAPASRIASPQKHPAHADNHRTGSGHSIAPGLVRARAAAYAGGVPVPRPMGTQPRSPVSGGGLPVRAACFSNPGSPTSPAGRPAKPCNGSIAMADHANIGDMPSVRGTSHAQAEVPHSSSSSADQDDEQHEQGIQHGAVKNVIKTQFSLAGLMPAPPTTRVRRVALTFQGQLIGRTTLPAQRSMVPAQHKCLASMVSPFSLPDNDSGDLYHSLPPTPNAYSGQQGSISFAGDQPGVLLGSLLLSSGADGWRGGGSGDHERFERLKCTSSGSSSSSSYLSFYPASETSASRTISCAADPDLLILPPTPTAPANVTVHAIRVITRFDEALSSYSTAQSAPVRTLQTGTRGTAADSAACESRRVGAGDVEAAGQLSHSDILQLPFSQLVDCDSRYADVAVALQHDGPSSAPVLLQMPRMQQTEPHLAQCNNTTQPIDIGAAAHLATTSFTAADSGTQPECATPALAAVPTADIKPTDRTLPGPLDYDSMPVGAIPKQELHMAQHMHPQQPSSAMLSRAASTVERDSAGDTAAAPNADGSSASKHQDAGHRVRPTALGLQPYSQGCVSQPCEAAEQSAKIQQYNANSCNAVPQRSNATTTTSACQPQPATLNTQQPDCVVGGDYQAARLVIHLTASSDQAAHHASSMHVQRVGSDKQQGELGSAALDAACRMQQLDITPRDVACAHLAGATNDGPRPSTAAQDPAGRNSQRRDEVLPSQGTSPEAAQKAGGSCPVSQVALPGSSIGCDSAQERPGDSVAASAMPAGPTATCGVPTASAGNSRRRGGKLAVKDHAIGMVMVREFPTVATMLGIQLLTVLSVGTEMHKSWQWKQGVGGSTRVMQCMVEGDRVYVSYASGWRRRETRHPVTRVQVPATGYQFGQTLVLETAERGCLVLEPTSGVDYATWVFGLNAALMVAQGAKVCNVYAACMPWSRLLVALR